MNLLFGSLIMEKNFVLLLHFDLSVKFKAYLVSLKATLIAFSFILVFFLAIEVSLLIHLNL